MNKQDEKLKRALAKMMPDVVEIGDFSRLEWIDDRICQKPVLDTELLHVCAMVEKTLGSSQCPTQSQFCQYIIALQEICGETPSLFATWQQRVTALAKVKGIEL